MIDTNNPVLGKLLKTAKQIPPQKWATILVAVIATGLWMSQLKAPAPSEQLRNPLADKVALPTYNPEITGNAQQQDLNQFESNLRGFLTEERQRAVIAIAQAYRSLASQYTQQADHPCYGKTARECLKTFWDNRKNTLVEIATTTPPTRSSPAALFYTPKHYGEELLKIEGLRLAEILEIPADARNSSQRSELEWGYPVLLQGQAIEELGIRPAIAAQNLELRQQKHNALQSQNPEEQAKTLLKLRQEGK